MARWKDISGRQFGGLTAICRTGSRKNGMSLWLCECECGNTTTIPINKLNSGETTSCGKHTPLNLIDLTGRRFTRLVVLKREGTYRAPNGTVAPRWTCLCDCGGSLSATGGNLRSGHTRSCGCLSSDITTARNSTLKEEISYSGAHRRTRRTRGPTSQYACAECSQAATQWAYKDNARNPRYDETIGVHYSMDPFDYDPMCIHCHVRMDTLRRKQNEAEMVE